MPILKWFKRAGLAISYLVKLGLSLTILLPILALADGAAAVDALQVSLIPMCLIFTELVQLRTSA